MAPNRWSARAARRLVLIACATLVGTPAAHALRIVDYNILNYPGTTGPTRDPSFRTILQPISPDVLVTEEMTSQAGVTEFLNSLNTMEPGQWAALPFVDGGDTDCALFYKPAKIGFASQWSFYPNSANLLRLVHVYRIRPVGYSSNAADIRLYALHLKASMGFESQRLAECTGLRDSINAVPPGTHAFAVGDFNFYTGAEPGMSKLLESQSDNDGRLYDPLGLQGVAWQDNTSMQMAWTQSPCKTGDTGCASGAATGGLDDRFDLILPTLNWNDGQGYELIAGSYVSVGNDGLHHNNSIQDPPTIPEGAAYATALHSVSDHLPVRIDIQVPAKISVPASLAFGAVIVGATPTQSLSVSNPAAVPADALDYTISPDAGFSAPAGPFSLAAGAPPASHTIGMSTASSGSKSGFLLMSADDPDNPSPAVSLSGTVLNHAQASLDSTSALLAQSLDFGEHAAGGFSTLMARVHDRGYDALRARLSVSSGTIVGGDDRFSIVGGFSTALVTGVAKTYTVQFDGAGATAGADYNATLTFASADEALPGSTSQPDLVVSLHAKMAAGPVGVPGGSHLPTATQLYPPFPNPVVDGTTVRFDLDRQSTLRLEVFDLTGRRLTTLAEGVFPAGRYDYPWDGRSAGGATLGSGLYFVRLSIEGAPTRIARFALVR
jgi:flagellar hook capping protein FlgD